MGNLTIGQSTPDKLEISLRETNFRIWARRESRGIQVLHSHPHLELHICEAGDGVIQTGGEVYSLAPGRVTLLYGPVIHQIDADSTKDYRRLVAIFPLALLSTGLTTGIKDVLPILPTRERPCIQFKVSPQQLDHLALLLLTGHDIYIHWEAGSLFRIANLMSQIFLFLNRSTEPFYEPNHHATPYENWIARRAEQLISGSHHELLPIFRLSELLEISPGHLWRIYSKVRRRSLRDYMTLTKLSLAEASLRSGCTVAEAATSSFFSHIGSFSRTFKQHMGISPGMYRSWVKEGEQVSDDAPKSL